MSWLPTPSAEVVKVAVVAPPLVASVPVPSVALPSLNVTVPVGVPEVLEATVAVKVTLWPEEDGFAEEARPVVEVALTTCVTVGDVLVLKVLSPP